MTRRSRPDGDRLVDRVASLCARVQEPLDLLQQVAVVVRPAIPYDVGAWLLVDPDTFLINGVFEEQVPREAQLRLMELELAADEDPNKFVDLGRARVPAASLGEATGGRLDRCLRWSRVYQPEGYGDEARAVFRTGPVTWGAVCLTRRATEPWFRGREIRLLARLSAHVAHGIRTGLLLNEYRADADPTAAPGLVVLDSAGRVESTSPRALEWLGPVQEGNLDGSIVVHQVAARARALADGAVAGPPAMARARAPTGEWLLVRGTGLEGDDGRIAVVMEPAHRADVAPLLMHVHQLTPREQEVTQLLLTGMATSDIARELCVSTETVRGHAKSVYSKLDVTGRAGLVASLSSEPRVRSAGAR